jgi:hypothetical protein
MQVLGRRDACSCARLLQAASVSKLLARTSSSIWLLFPDLLFESAEPRAHHQEATMPIVTMFNHCKLRAGPNSFQTPAPPSNSSPNCFLIQWLDVARTHQIVQRSPTTPSQDGWDSWEAAMPVIMQDQQKLQPGTN